MPGLPGTAAWLLLLLVVSANTVGQPTLQSKLLTVILTARIVPLSRLYTHKPSTPTKGLNETLLSSNLTETTLYS